MDASTLLQSKADSRFASLFRTKAVTADEAVNLMKHLRLTGLQLPVTTASFGQGR